MHHLKAMAAALLCRELGAECQVVSGRLGEQPCFWAVVSAQEGWRHLDLSRWTEEDAPLLTDGEMTALGYLWDTALVPPCG